MTFPPTLLAELRSRIALVELARGATKLRKQGSRYLGCCPFHQERTPSFSIDPDKGVFYCFGCKAGGDLFAFVELLHGLDFKGAVRHLAEQAGLPIVGDSPAERAAVAQRRALGEALGRLQRLFVWQLGQPEGIRAREYLRSRHIAPGTARAFGVGYGGSASQLAARLQKAGLGPELLEQSGARAPHSRHPILFEERLTLPVSEPTGRVVGFGGRLLGAQNDTSGAKYLNSRDSILFQKHRELFGLAQAMPLIRRHRRVIVCEGYLDVLALWQAGHGESVAALGTQLTAAHAELLARLAPEVVLIFDGDRAGHQAARRAAGPLKQHGLELSLVPLPKGEDPASLAASAGSKALAACLAGRSAALDLFIVQAFAEAGDAIQARLRAANELAPLILGLPQPLERELYTARVAQALGVPAERLTEEWRGLAKQLAREQARQRQESQARPAAPQPASNGHRPAQAAQGTASAAAPRAGAKAGAGAQHAAKTEGTAGNGEAAGAPPAVAASQAEAAEAAEAGWRRANARRLAEQELDMLRELLLYPSIYCQLGPLAEYLVTPELQQLVTALTAAQPGKDPDTLQQWFDLILTQCVTTPRWLHRLRAVTPPAAQPLDEAAVRANRTLEDILRRLKQRQVDWTLRGVLRELGEAESRGEATDGLLRRKQLLTARKRALS